MAVKARPHFDNPQGQQFRVRFVQPLLKFEGESLVHAAICDMQIVDIGHSLFALDIKHVDIVKRCRHHLALGFEPLY